MCGKIVCAIFFRKLLRSPLFAGELRFYVISHKWHNNCESECSIMCIEQEKSKGCLLDPAHADLQRTIVSKSMKNFWMRSRIEQRYYYLRMLFVSCVSGSTWTVIFNARDSAPDSGCSPSQ